MTTILPPNSLGRPRRVDRWSLVRTTGELFITLGCLLLLFAVYELVWTNVSADRHESAVRRGLERTFPSPAASAHPGTSTSTLPNQPPLQVKRNKAFAVMYIPALGKHWAKAVIEGSALSDLKGTLGHYPQTQLPGQLGNFAVAGHRATNGQPLADIPKLVTGSLVYVHTAQAWYVYRITSHKIVAPDAVSVLLPVPDRPSIKATEAKITITTCNPRWASFQRWIVFGTLQSARPDSAGPPPGLDVRG